MAENETYIVKKRDLAEIIHSADPGALEAFLDDPVAVIAQATLEMLSHGPIALAGPAVRIVQGALKGSMFRQLAKEIKDLREKGKIDEDFSRNKYSFQSWVELLTIIDEDRPDEDRLETLKAMFFAVNKVKANDGERILGYQLFQIAKKLTSNELLVLKAVYEIHKSGSAGTLLSFREWANIVSGRLGHSLTSLIDHADSALVANRLLSDRYSSDRSGIHGQNFRLTDLGLKFCENIEHYRIEKSPSG